MDINAFKWCSGVRVLGYFMILLVAAIVAVSYYAVVVLTWGPQLLRGGLRTLLAAAILFVFHLLLALLSWCYFKAVFKDPGSVPENWRPAVTEEENLEAGGSSSIITSSDHVAPDALVPTWSSDGLERKQVGYCAHCQNGKPPRCHHCSICQRCILKMDHHCVWVVNCVGAHNYNEAMNHSSSPGNLAIIFLAFVLNLAFALSLLCFIIMHASLVSSNTTSVEVYEKKKTIRWRYDLGRKKNFEQVFGTKKALWLLPLFSKEDLENIPALQGLEFPTRSDVEA
ncbi:putative protein s-acyltransferase 12 [Quercus suber]|uniref:S-acyltransferase n=1 Tax=Quercus suber TaxID=58331 RepID=A0AAW0LPW7_QUESU